MTLSRSMGRELRRSCCELSPLKLSHEARSWSASTRSLRSCSLPSRIWQRRSSYDLSARHSHSLGDCGHDNYGRDRIEVNDTVVSQWDTAISSTALVLAGSCFAKLVPLVPLFLVFRGQTAIP